MRIGRRRFLGLGGAMVGAAALPAVLAACGSGGGDGSSSTGVAEDDDSGGTGGPGRSEPSTDVPPVVVKRFSDTANAAGPARLPITLAGSDGVLVTTGPATLTGRILDADGTEVTTFSVDRRDAEIANPYWPVRVDLATPGIYELFVDGTDANGVAFQLFDAAEVATPVNGDPLPPFDTPTVDDARGVNPVCTLTPDPCPFHEITLTEALASGKHVVYMVGTPAHCQFGTCAPGLEFLVDLAPDYADRAVFVHADVYTDDTATTVAPAVGAIGLDYEPVIYITDATGAVVDRLDVIWDRTELDEVLARTIT
jgi:hypothetical protein